MKVPSIEKKRGHMKLLRVKKEKKCEHMEAHRKKNKA